MVSAGDFSTKLPCTASYEGCGKVVAWGSSVKAFKKGDRVMAAIPFHRYGVRSITIWGGLMNAGLKAGETVALVGAGGGLGHLGCQFAKAMGLQVVGIDARDPGLDLARTSGADVVIDARIGKEKVVEEVEEVKKVTDQKGDDSALTISDAPGAAALACAIKKMYGTMIQIA
ncbi:MAG: hypothetical protein Q9226_003573 [Calogaya cf. arnoldii]